MVTFHQVSSPKLCMHLSCPGYMPHVPPISLLILSLNIMWWEVQIIKLLIILLHSHYFIPLMPRYLSQNPNELFSVHVPPSVWEIMYFEELYLKISCMSGTISNSKLFQYHIHLPFSPTVLMIKACMHSLIVKVLYTPTLFPLIHTYIIYLGWNSPYIGDLHEMALFWSSWPHLMRTPYIKTVFLIKSI
jgi:hypothetical protein